MASSTCHILPSRCASCACPWTKPWSGW